MLTKSKETINWMKQDGYFHIWLLPPNGIQDGTSYAGHPVGNSPEFMPLDNSLNRDILHSFCIHSVLIYYILYGDATDKEERTVRFSY